MQNLLGWSDQRKAQELESLKRFYEHHLTAMPPERDRDRVDYAPHRSHDWGACSCRGVGVWSGHVDVCRWDSGLGSNVIPAGRHCCRSRCHRCMALEAPRSGNSQPLDRGPASRDDNCRRHGDRPVRGRHADVAVRGPRFRSVWLCQSGGTLGTGRSRRRAAARGGSAVA